MERSRRRESGVSGTAFVGDEPQMYFISIESQSVDWSLTVEERMN
jgi:hypothetical protein